MNFKFSHTFIFMSAISFNLDKSKNLSFGKELSCLSMTKGSFVDSVDEEQTVKNVQNDL